MELMNKHIDSGFREELCLRIFCDLCEAMAKLHLRRVPIIHRDIKVCIFVQDLRRGSW